MIRKIIAVGLGAIALWPLGKIRLGFSGQTLGYNIWQLFLIVLLLGAAHEIWTGKNIFSTQRGRKSRDFDST